MTMQPAKSDQFDQLIAEATFEGDEAECGRYTLVRPFGDSEVWVFEWRDNFPVLVAERVVHS
jgi:hypothetical protein